MAPRRISLTVDRLFFRKGHRKAVFRSASAAMACFSGFFERIISWFVKLLFSV